MECAQNSDLLPSHLEAKPEVEIRDRPLENNPHSTIEGPEGKRGDSEVIEAVSDPSKVDENKEIDAPETQKKSIQKNEVNSKAKKSASKERPEITETQGSKKKQTKSEEENLVESTDKILDIPTNAAETTANENGDPSNAKRSKSKQVSNSKSKSKQKKDESQNKTNLKEETQNQKQGNENARPNSISKKESGTNREINEQSPRELKRSQINETGLVNVEEPATEAVKSVKKSTAKSHGKSKQKKQTSID